MGYVIGERIEHYVPDAEQWKIQELRTMWKEKYTIMEIAARIGWHEFETAILVMDQIRENKIKMRPEGIVVQTKPDPRSMKS